MIINIKTQNYNFQNIKSRKLLVNNKSKQKHTKAHDISPRGGGGYESLR